MIKMTVISQPLQTLNKPAITESNFAPMHLANLTKHNVVFDRGPLPQLWENMASSAKPEVHNVLHCHRRGHSHGHR